MNFKKISFTVLEEDIRGIDRNSLTLVIGRLGVRLQEKAAKVNDSLNIGNSIEILDEVQNLIEGLEESIKELQNLADLIGEVSDVEAPEVLEDSEE